MSFYYNTLLKKFKVLDFRNDKDSKKISNIKNFGDVIDLKRKGYEIIIFPLFYIEDQECNPFLAKMVKPHMDPTKCFDLPYLMVDNSLHYLIHIESFMDYCVVEYINLFEFCFFTET